MSNNTKTHSTPKDFVLWLGAMIALYISVGSLIALLFSYIDILMPDALENYYRDPFSGGIRFAMASLIIMVPIYLVLTRLLNKDIRKNPEKKNIGIRRWLLYITLLAAGLTIAGDLIALVNGFLGGELTARFFTKILVILGVIGAVFAYYIVDIRGYWDKNETLSKTIGIMAGLFVLASIVAGFFILGSPSEQRAIRFDQERIQNLQTIQWGIIDHWQSKGELPNELNELNNSLNGFATPLDPTSGQSYEYTTTGVTTFEVCATFSKQMPAYTSSIDRFGAHGIVGSNWDYTPGRTCFERTIDPDKFPPRKQTQPLLPTPADV